MVSGFKRIKACFSDSPFIIIPISIENASNKMMPITYAINAWLAGEDSLIFNTAKCRIFRRSQAESTTYFKSNYCQHKRLQFHIHICIKYYGPWSHVCIGKATRSRSFISAINEIFKLKASVLLLAKQLCLGLGESTGRIWRCCRWDSSRPHVQRLQAVARFFSWTSTSSSTHWSKA